MAFFGTGGKNKNFQPAFTVPALQTLHGYAVGGITAKLYRSVDIRRTIPKAKLAAVRTAAVSRKAKIQFRYGSYPMDVGGAGGFRVFLSHPATPAATPWTAASVTSLLAAIETAITT